MQRIIIARARKRDRERMQKALQSTGAAIQVVSTTEEALDMLTREPHGLLITDLHGPRLSGIGLSEAILQNHRWPVTVVVVAESACVEEAVHAMRLGVFDFVHGPSPEGRIVEVAERALRERWELDRHRILRETMEKDFTFHKIVSRSQKMRRIFDDLIQVANTGAAVLIEGETGTGKELVAQAIHALTTKRDGPLIAVDVGMLPKSLITSELFGHERGAFTSAMYQRRGRFELANHGTLFLDEVGTMPRYAQAMLLRVLDNGRFERVGGQESVEVDVRIITASRYSLEGLVSQGKFRDDLYYRLAVVEIELPPLRDRPEDIPLLADYFLQKHVRPGSTAKQFDSAAKDILQQHSWPGNVRQLEKTVQRLAAMTRSDVIRPADLAFLSGSGE